MKNTQIFEAARADANARRGARIVRELEKRGHCAHYAESAQDALSLVLSLIPLEASVGIPGSVTIREVGALEALSQRGNRVVHHWNPSFSPAERDEARFDENNCDVFLTSSNAITDSGIMVNIDGAGNRLAGMCWCRGTRIFVIGMNKVCPDTETALRRVRDIATPANAGRLQLNSPCATTGHHVNGCTGLNCLCRALLITEQAPTMPFGKESHVILVGESLGY